MKRRRWSSRIPRPTHTKVILSSHYGKNTKLIHDLAREITYLRDAIRWNGKAPVLVVSKDDGQDEIYYDPQLADVMVVHTRDEIEMALCEEPIVRKFNDLWWPRFRNNFTFYAKNNR